MTELIDKLKFWMLPKEEIFLRHANDILGSKVEARKHSKNTRRIFIDNGGDVLFVAHLDTVLLPGIVKRTKKRLHATGLDDRLGCLLAYELGIKLGADILLTDDEEKCQSTAQHHLTKNYNWTVEFDRDGDDVVTYGIDSYDFRNALTDCWDIGIGSYSDIMDLPTLTCCFNLGIGYKYAHSIDSYVDLKVLRKQIHKFEWFYEKHHDTRFMTDVRAEVPNFNSYISDNECDLCGSIYDVEEVHDYLICRDCFGQVLDNFFLIENGIVT